MTKMKRATFDDVCELCRRDLKGDTCTDIQCLVARSESKKYRGAYSLSEYRQALTQALPKVHRQLRHGIHEQDRKDAAEWLITHGPLVRALQVAANHGIK